MPNYLYSIKWDKIQEKIIFQNQYLTLYNDLVLKPDKKETNFLKIQTKNFSTVFCVTNENKVVLVRQYRYAFDGFSWECPGGIIDDGEEPIECAIREVLEETGYKVLEIKESIKCHPNAYSTSWGYTFIAKVEKSGEQHLDDNEFILVQEFDISKVQHLIAQGKFSHGPSLISYLFFENSNKIII